MLINAYRFSYRILLVEEFMGLVDSDRFGSCNSKKCLQAAFVCVTGFFENLHF